MDIYYKSKQKNCSCGKYPLFTYFYIQRIVLDFDGKDFN